MRGIIDNTYFRRGVVRITFIIPYLFITYIVTSKPKRISVAAGVVHIVYLLKSIECTHRCAHVHILRFYKHVAIRKTIKKAKGPEGPLHLTVETIRGITLPSQIKRLENRTYLVGQNNRSYNAHEICNVRYLYRNHRPCYFAMAYEQSVSYRLARL